MRLSVIEAHCWTILEEQILEVKRKDLALLTLPLIFVLLSLLVLAHSLQIKLLITESCLTTSQHCFCHYRGIPAGPEKVAVSELKELPFSLYMYKTLQH